MPRLGCCSSVEWEGSMTQNSMQRNSMPQNREEQLPLFVYGTLMSGQRAYERLRPAVETFVPASLVNVALYSLGEYPMAVPGNGVIVGELHWLAPDSHDQVLVELDQYEGVGFGYTREQITVQLRGAEDVRAWVYFGVPDIAVQHPHILSGDWRVYQNGGAV